MTELVIDYENITLNDGDVLRVFKDNAIMQSLYSMSDIEVSLGISQITDTGLFFIAIHLNGEYFTTLDNVTGYKIDRWKDEATDELVRV